MIWVPQNYSRVFCFLTFLIILAACTRYDIDELPKNALPDVKFTDPLEGLADEGPIKFKNPNVGQRSAYVFFEVTHTRSTGNIDFKYEKDTLVMAITGKQSSTWIIKEFLTAGSIARSEPHLSFWGHVADSVFVSELVIDADSVHIFRQGGYRAAITFSLLAEQKFPLSLVPDTYPENPKALPFFGVSLDRWMEYTKNFVRLQVTYAKLNIYFDNSWIVVDGPGFMCVYEAEAGIVRTTRMNPWFPEEAAGWDLIPR